MDVYDDLRENFDQVLKHVTCKDNPKSNHSLKSGMWRDVFRIDPIPGSSEHRMIQIVLKSQAKYYYYNIIEIMRKHSTANNFHIDDKIIDKKIMDFLIKYKCVDQATNLSIAIKKWFDEIDNIPIKTYVIFLPINHFYLFEELIVDNVKIIKLSEDVFRKYFKICDEIDQSLYTDLIRTNETDKFMIVEVSSKDVDSAKQMAQEYVEKFIHAFKLFHPKSSISVRKNTYSLVSEYFFSIEKNTNKPNFGTHHHFSSVGSNNDISTCDLSSHWNKLTKFLFSKSLSSLQTSILTAMYWYGQVDILRDSNIRKFLSYLTGLEILLVTSDRKAYEFGKNISQFFSRNEKYALFYSAYYKKRNNLIHEKIVPVFDDEVDSLRILLQSTLLNMIKDSDRYESTKEYLKNEL